MKFQLGVRVKFNPEVISNQPHLADMVGVVTDPNVYADLKDCCGVEVAWENENEPDSREREDNLVLAEVIVGRF